MKKLFTPGTLIMIVCLLAAIDVFSQAQHKMSYQAVVRNSEGELLKDAQVGVQMSVLQGTESGEVVYQETHTATTNANGLLNLVIGDGEVVQGDLSSVDWANGPYFVKIEIEDDVVSRVRDKFYLGQDTLGGIVFYVYVGKDREQHGLIVSKTQSKGAYDSSVDPEELGADRTEDGMWNTDLIPISHSTAKTWVASLGEGWYLPSIDELFLLFNNRFHVNRSLRAGGHTLLAYNLFYWSSTEYTANYGFVVDFYLGGGSYNEKGSSLSVRAIRSF